MNNYKTLSDAIDAINNVNATKKSDSQKYVIIDKTADYIEKTVDIDFYDFCKWYTISTAKKYRANRYADGIEKIYSDAVNGVNAEKTLNDFRNGVNGYSIIIRSKRDGRVLESEFHNDIDIAKKSAGDIMTMDAVHELYLFFAGNGITAENIGIPRGYYIKYNHVKKIAYIRILNGYVLGKSYLYDYFTRELYRRGELIGDENINLSIISDFQKSTDKTLSELCNAVDTDAKNILAPAEKNVYELLLNGYSRDKISVELDISRGTVNNQISRIRKKLGMLKSYELLIEYLTYYHLI